ncbi:peptide chain release factor N(5)-glutamine methyltransferase [Idiomarina xiamenensis]|uniref:Release factor glutamine methyltransferase n=1 Tax=Idiomarina xiamenensis 10-D-4 TaxID=740709 RepID=K2JHG0_9GAMM|nr:peptide chain release factor N(5)-glutamine methyltransferase [Idiomarina xiamenensis]EKE82781.1 HemK family modification methylase [Idiomarina xiamenensis 10-D-4]
MLEPHQPTLALVWQQATTQLKRVSETPRLDAQILLCQVLQQAPSYLHTWPERQLTAAQQQAFQALLARRLRGLPMAYITGQREFWSLPLQVSDATLIPRPDTEVLVEHALTLALPATAKVLDLGTGSGAIALALKHERPAWQVHAVEQSPAALAVAKSNAEQLDLAVTFYQGSWFAGLPQTATDRFDLIVANPPYIDIDDPHLQQGDVRFEPSSALVAENNGFADLFYLIQHARQHLKSAAWLLLEHGYTQAAAVRDKFVESGYKKVNSVVDYANVERITAAQYDQGLVTSDE